MNKTKIFFANWGNTIFGLLVNGMITYNPKDWFTFIFKIHRTETFRELLPLMLGIGLYAFIISYIELHNLVGETAKEVTRNLSAIFGILGFTLSLLLVFRTNSAYDRWWEGRKQWGELVNASRALAAQLNALISFPNHQSREVVANYISLFAYSLQAHLASKKIALANLPAEISITALSDESIQTILASSHQPQETYKQLVNYVHSMIRNNEFTAQDSYLFKSELNKLIEVCGACERIRNTPIPFSYSVFLKKFIFFYVMLFPIIYGINMSYFIIPATVFILYVLASIEIIAEEIEDPFNNDANDLPTYDLAMAINKSAKAILLAK